MAHEILYQMGIGGDDSFHTFTIVWEPHTDRVSLRFRNKREAANGMVGSVAEIIGYLDSRAEQGYPWDCEAPRAARGQLAQIMGGLAPADPLATPDEEGITHLRVG